MALTKEEIEASFAAHVKECGCNVCKQAELQKLALHKCAFCNWSAEADNLASDAPRPYLALHTLFPKLAESGWSVLEHKVSNEGEDQMVVMVPPMGVSKITQCFFGSVKDKGLYLVATTYDDNFVGEWFTDLKSIEEEEEDDSLTIGGGLVDVDMSGGGVMVPGSVLDGAKDTDDVIKRLTAAAAAGGGAGSSQPASKTKLESALDRVIKRAQDGENDLPPEIEEALMQHVS